MKSNIPAVVAPVIADPSAKVERRSLLRDLGDLVKVIVVSVVIFGVVMALELHYYL